MIIIYLLQHHYQNNHQEWWKQYHLMHLPLCNLNNIYSSALQVLCLAFCQWCINIHLHLDLQEPVWHAGKQNVSTLGDAQDQEIELFVLVSSLISTQECSFNCSMYIFYYSAKTTYFDLYSNFEAFKCTLIGTFSKLKMTGIFSVFILRMNIKKHYK